MDDVTRRPRRLRIRASRRVAGLWITTALLLVFFASLNDGFLATDNLLGLVRSGATLAIIAMGLTLVIVIAEIDLSIGAVYGLGATTLAVLWIKADLGLYAALALCLALGALIGLVNATVTVYARVPSFVTTLGTLSIASGLSTLIGETDYYSPEFAQPPLNASEVEVFKALGGSTLPGDVPIQIVWFVALGVIFAILMHRSLFGFRLAAMGGNADAARVAGLKVTKYKIVVFTVCALMATLAGVLDFSFIGATQPGAGNNLTFPAFAAVIIGGASLSGGHGTIVGTLSGAMLLAVLSNGLALIGLASGAQLVFVGCITILAVALDQWLVPGSALRSLGALHLRRR